MRGLSFGILLNVFISAASFVLYFATPQAQTLNLIAGFSSLLAACFLLVISTRK